MSLQSLNGLEMKESKKIRRLRRSHCRFVGVIGSNEWRISRSNARCEMSVFRKDYFRKHDTGLL